MAELADALDLGSSGDTRAGSSPVNRIIRKTVSFMDLVIEWLSPFFMF